MIESLGTFSKHGHSFEVTALNTLSLHLLFLLMTNLLVEKTSFIAWLSNPQLDDANSDKKLLLENLEQIRLELLWLGFMGKQ